MVEELKKSQVRGVFFLVLLLSMVNVVNNRELYKCLRVNFKCPHRKNHYICELMDMLTRLI